MQTILIRGLSLFILLQLTFGCNTEKKLSGGIATNKGKSGPTTLPEGTGTTSKNIPACSQDSVGITQAKLLSKGISQIASKQSFRYELSAVNCKDGSVIPIANQTLYFDLNAESEIALGQVSYAVSDATQGTIISEGILELVAGNDLFGNTGRYNHWKTASMNYTSALPKLVLEIRLEDITVKPINPLAKSIDSYLKIGSSQAVMQPLSLLD